MIPFALLSAAIAGNVYINGVRADLPPEMTLSNVTVRFDAQGNVWIEAPGYRVEVLQPTEYARPAPTTSAPTEASGAPRVSLGTWWLVTEDNGSTGQNVDVLVNGVLVRRITSGEPQMILDLAPWLRPGPNTVAIQPVLVGQAGGGALNIYLGRGTNLAGTIHLDNPDVVYSRRASDTGGTKQYTLTVP